MNRKLGTKWFTFYTKVKPWLSCLTAFMVLMDFTLYVEIYLENFFLLLSFALSITQTVLSIVVLVKSDEDYVKFVPFVKKVLIFEIISIAYQQGVDQYIKNEFDFGYAFFIFVVVLVLGYFTWYKLNIKYFTKRLVVEPTIIEHIGKNENNDELERSNCGEIRFCRKCGTSLEKDSLFCRKCGTEIKEEQQ
jgi:ribosomal protein L40E